MRISFENKFSRISLNLHSGEMSDYIKCKRVYSTARSDCQPSSFRPLLRRRFVVTMGLLRVSYCIVLTL